METVILLTYISTTNLLVGNLWLYNNSTSSVVIANVYVSNCQSSFCNGTITFTNNEIVSTNLDNFVVIAVNNELIYTTNGIEAKVCSPSGCNVIGNAVLNGRLISRYYNLGNITYVILNDQKTIFVMNPTSIIRYTSPLSLCNWFWLGEVGLYITHTSDNILWLLDDNATLSQVRSYPVNCPKYFTLGGEDYYMDTNYMIVKGNNNTGVTMLLTTDILILENSQKLVFETLQGIFITDMNFSSVINITDSIHAYKWNETSIITYTDSTSQADMKLITIPLSLPTPISTPTFIPISETIPQSTLTPSIQPEVNLLAIVIPIVIGTIVIAAGIAVAVVFRRKRRHRRKKATVGESKLSSNDLVLGALLGSGSYGQVYEATYHKSKVAVKVSNDDSLLEEIDLLVNLKPHPYVVRVFGSVKIDNKHMLIMEYCDGGSCNDYIEKHHPNIDTKVKWIKEIIAGLIHLHESDVVHRDIAARNILIDRGVAKISDLGFARKLSVDPGATKSNIGPLRWMAPESIKDRKYSRQSDIWMLGMLIYEIIAEAEPYWDAPDIIEVISKVRDSGLMLPLHELDRKWADIILLCCKYNPSERVDLSTLYNIIDS